MFFVWGNGTGVVDAGVAPGWLCPVCGRTTDATIKVQYHYGHVYWVFGMVTRFDYFAVCGECHEAAPVTAEWARPHITRVPVPFARRYGCLVGGLLFAGVIALLATRFQ